MAVLRRALRRAERRQLDAARRAIDVGGEAVLGRAQELAPVDTGALQASGTATSARADRRGIEKEVGFNTDYAAAVHERLDLRIRTDRNPLARSKYLAAALAEKRGAVLRLIAAEMEAAL
jgi:hypothetical protein